MRAVPGFQKAQARLRMEGCSYRLREVARSPFAYVYELDPPQRQQVARCCRIQDDEACERLTELLLEAGKNRAAGGRGLDWDFLSRPLGKPSADPAASTSHTLTWGEIRGAIKADIAPGGPKARDRNPFVCFRDRGFFGVMFPDTLPAKPEHLEQFCLYTPDSIQANRAEPECQLVPREYNSKVFYQVIQMVNYLAKKGISIATPQLKERLAGLKTTAGRGKAPKPRFIPATDDIESWLDQLVSLDPFRGWVMAMVATYGLRNHEIWHVDALPGEIDANPRMISVGSFSSTSDGSETKTGHRFALALPEAWLERYRLNDHEHARAMLEQLRRSHPILTTERPDGMLQFHNNEALSRVLSHWFRNSAREDRELPVKLYGWHQPRAIPGRPKPKAIQDRCKVYDLRHAWALRAKETTTWSTTLKAMAMGHSEAVHTRRYLVEEQALHRLEGMNRLLALDEGGVHIPTHRRRGAQRLTSAEPAAPAPRQAPALPDGITPELIEMARKLKAAGLG
jgi:hypothetical protein